jgi:DNA-binding MarR family transcriptional regulator
MKSTPGRDYALVLAVLSTADTFLRESQRLFRPLGLTGAQFNVLNILSDQPQGMSQRALGDELVVDRSNVTGLLDRMEKAGWVRRQDHPGDRRVYLILLTPAGRELWEKAGAHYYEVVRQITAKLSDKQMNACMETLGVLKREAAVWKLPEP